VVTLICRTDLAGMSLDCAHRLNDIRLVGAVEIPFIDDWLAITLFICPLLQHTAVVETFHLCLLSHRC